VSDRLQMLLDRSDIAQLCARYMTALDTLDWALLATCFAPAPTFVHPGGRLEGFAEILARTQAALTPLTRTQHLLGNVSPQVRGDLGSCSSYFHAQHVRTGTPGGDLYVIAGRYDDTVTRTADGWRITERVQTYLWRSGNRDVVAR
jgi:hypothetical protein